MSDALPTGVPTPGAHHGCAQEEGSHDVCHHGSGPWQRSSKSAWLEMTGKTGTGEAAAAHQGVTEADSQEPPEAHCLA